MMTQHIVASYENELRELGRKIAEMGGQVERLVADSNPGNRTVLRGGPVLCYYRLSHIAGLLVAHWGGDNVRRQKRRPA